MYVLKDLWNGKIVPFEKPIWANDEYFRIMDKIVKQEKQLSALLSEEDKQILVKYQDDQCALAEISAEESFINGFRLGAQLMLDVLSRN